jgi:hypothetical protein
MMIGSKKKPMSQTLELPDEVFEALAKVAREGGVTPAEWLAINLHSSEASTQKRPLPELWNDVIGSVDSTKTQSTHQTAFSTALTEKFRKQGLRIP